MKENTENKQIDLSELGPGEFSDSYLVPNNSLEIPNIQEDPVPGSPDWFLMRGTARFNPDNIDLIIVKKVN